MSTLQETLTLEKASIIEISGYPGKKGMNVVLTMQAPLTSDAARILKCQDRFFTINETPYTDFQGRITLKPVVKHCKVSIGEEIETAAAALLPDLIWKFNIGLEKDARPSVAFRMHFDGQWRNILMDWVNAVNTDEFTVSIVALQANLFEALESAEEGTRIDVDAKPAAIDERQMTIDQAMREDRDTGCTSCNAGLPLMDLVDGEPAKHHSGELCTARPVSANTLPSAREMAGLGEAPRRGRGRPRKDANGAANGSVPPPADPGSSEYAGEFEQV